MANSYLGFSTAVKVKTEKLDLISSYLSTLEVVMIDDCLGEVLEGETADETAVKNAVAKFLDENNEDAFPNFDEVKELMLSDSTLGFIVKALETNEGLGFLNCCMELRRGNSEIILCTEDDDSPYMGAVAGFVYLLFLLDFLDEEYVLIDFCWWCDKPRLDSFAGGAVLISPDLGVRFKPCSEEWAMHELKGY